MPRLSLRAVQLTTGITLTGGLLLSGLLGAAAEPFPAATEQLRDFDGAGFMQVDLPATKTNAAGVKLMVGYRQQFVRPDRTLIDVEVAGARRRTLIQGNTEHSFSPGLGYRVECTYRNIEAAKEDPIAARRMSILGFGQALKELQSAKVLPAEALEETEKKAKARLEELATLRKLLSQSKNEEDLPRAQDAASEMARVRDLVEQVPIFKAHPCWVVEIPNEELTSTLLAKGLMGEDAKPVLVGGKTRVWVTKTQGVPLRMEAASPDGRVAVYFCFRDVKINQGLTPGEVVLGAPSGLRQFSATADLREEKWEEKMTAQLQKQHEAWTREQKQAADRNKQLNQQPIRLDFPKRNKRK